MSSVDLQEAELAMEFRCMEIVEVVLSGEKKQLRHGREGEGAKQGLHLSLLSRGVLEHGEHHRVAP